MAGKKELIMAAALKLLEQRNYKEISVLDIVEESNVNRNTFYYHFKDMPDLIEKLVCRSVDRAFDNTPGSLLDKLKAAVDSAYENRKIALHVYNYADRSIFDKGLDKACDHLVGRVFECCPELQRRSEEERERIYTICKACNYGLICEWMLRGLPEEGKGVLYAICEDCANLLK